MLRVGRISTASGSATKRSDPLPKTRETVAGAVGDQWEMFDFHFSELRDLFAMMIETKDQAIGERDNDAGTKPSPTGRKQGKRKRSQWTAKTPQWDSEFGKVRSWLLVPYVDGIDYQELRNDIELARPLIDLVASGLAERKVTLQLLAAWGGLNYVGGQINVVYGAEPTVGHARSALAGGDARRIGSENHQRWFAHYFLRLYRRGNRKAVEKAIETLINSIIDGNVDGDFDVKWFEEFLFIDDAVPSDNRYPLRAAYNEDSLSVKRMKELVAKGSEGIPRVDLEFRKP